jgi:hypothetical protein
VNTIIGIAGPARSGKDTLCNQFLEIFQEMNIKAKRSALAYQLKLESKDFIFNTLGIDVFTEKTEEKNIIRPFLVTWGTHVRRKLDPDIWIKKIQDSIEENSILIVPDIRFKNEFDWVKNNNGYMFFVDRINENRELVPDANQDEAENNTFLRESSDHSFVWCTTEDKKILISVAFEIISNTISDQQLSLWRQTYSL